MYTLRANNLLILKKKKGAGALQLQLVSRSHGSVWEVRDCSITIYSNMYPVITVITVYTVVYKSVSQTGTYLYYAFKYLYMHIVISRKRKG